MRIIDVTHIIANDMPVYPGTEQPVLTTACEIETDGFLEQKITFYSHTGTHIDAPAHIIKGAATLDLLPIHQFYGRAVRVDITPDAGDAITMEHLIAHRGIIQGADFLLLHTGWSRWWGQKRYFVDYPVLTPDAAEWLRGLKLKGVGLDTISADRFDSLDFPVHKTLLGSDCIIIENLTNLDKLPNHSFLFSCFPLNFKQADGSPVRAVAIIDEEHPS